MFNRRRFRISETTFDLCLLDLFVHNTNFMKSDTKNACRPRKLRSSMMHRHVVIIDSFIPNANGSSVSIYLPIERPLKAYCTVCVHRAGVKN